MVSVSSSGSWQNTETFLEFMQQERMFQALEYYGRIGVDLLTLATPLDTGETASSWSYRVENKPGRHEINWYNSHIDDGVHIAVILQYGHGTGTGGWVEGRDYINPAMQPLFEKIVDDLWKQVSNG